MNLTRSRGFSLVELAIVLVIFGVLMSFSVPMIQGFTSTQNLKGATENLAGQLRLARQVAIDTGKSQTMHCFYQSLLNGQLSDYHMHSGGVVGAMWSLPKGITYNWAAGTASVYIFGSDGRVNTSGMLILRNTKGEMDTVSVQGSGMVTCR
jgi:type IV fimbrial biogenesis protein FimT